MLIGTGGGGFIGSNMAKAQNVYGPREQHKGSMSGAAFHCHNRLRDNGVLRLFEGSDGYADGEQRRDFIYVTNAVLAYSGRGEIEYIPFPEHHRGRYQRFTEADIGRLRGAGYDQPFGTVDEGVRACLDWLNRN